MKLGINITIVAEKLKKDIFSKNNSEGITITIAIDGGTFIKNKIFNVMILNSENSIYFTSIEHRLDESSTHDAQGLSANLLPIFTFLIENEKLIIVAVTHDNEPLNLATIKLLQKEFPFLLSSPCICHILTLLVRDLMESPIFDNIGNFIYSIIYKIDSDQKIRSKIDGFL